MLLINIMDECKMSKYLAYTMLVYTIASLYYFVISRKIGTPFNDSLTDEQKEIKRQSSNKRRNIFLIGLVFAIVMVYMLHPFNSC